MGNICLVYLFLLIPLSDENLYEQINGLSVGHVTYYTNTLIIVTGLYAHE
jgi:hypothetical protein